MIPSRHVVLQMLAAFSLPFALGTAHATGSIVVPPPSLLLSGTPPIERALEQRMTAYMAFRGQRLMNWHPQRDELLILQRAARSSQVFRLTAPGRPPELLTEVRSIDPARADSDRLIARLPGIGWSVQSIAPDKKALVIGEFRGAVESYLWTLDIESGTKKILRPVATSRLPHTGPPNSCRPAGASWH